MVKWLIAGDKIQGINHQKNGLPCQDALNYINDKKYVCATIADGAGSAKYANLASEIITKKIPRIIEQEFDNFLFQDEKIIKFRIIHRLRTVLGIIAKKYSASIKEFNSTLLFVAIKGNYYISGHIGDGAIGLLKRNGNLKTLSPPLNGEFKNETFFVTSKDYQKYFRIYKGILNDISGFILATDGTTESLYNYKTNNFAEISKSIIKWLNKYDEKTVSNAIKINLEKVISRKTGDDCTLLVMKKIE